MERKLDNWHLRRQQERRERRIWKLGLLNKLEMPWYTAEMMSDPIEFPIFMMELRDTILRKVRNK